MVIGIIGKGKMGKDLFHYLSQFEEHQLVWICRRTEDVGSVTETVTRQLQKMRNRGVLDEAAYRKRSAAYKVVADYDALKDCQLVIESVTEELALKQDLFPRLESVVSPDCILASNTSSLPLHLVFTKCSRQTRCLGLHFFFPVRVTKVVELNTLNCTERRYIAQARDFLTGIEKTVLELSAGGNMLLTHLINLLTAHLYQVCEERCLPAQELDRVLKEQLLLFGLFEILDATGVNICIKSMEYFETERYRTLFRPLYHKMQQLLQEGYPGGNGHKGLLAYEREHPVALRQLDETRLAEVRRNVVLDLQCLLANELALVLTRQTVAKDQLGAAVREVFGLPEDPFVMAQRLGAQTIIARLTACYRRFADPVYQPLDLGVLGLEQG